MNRKGKKLFLWCVFFSMMLFGRGVFATPSIRVLIYSGANNHNWSETTPVLKKILADAGVLVDVTEHPEQMTREQLSRYDVIVSNWNNFGKKKLVWPEATRKAFLDFIKTGGGHVMVHAGGSSFYDWQEYHTIAASWGEKTSHGPVHEFMVTIKEPNHPICRGMDSFKMADELWRNTDFPANHKVLMTAFSSKQSGGRDTHEPVLTVSNYGKGRCVNVMLGHDGKTMAVDGFKTVLARSVSWAADQNTSDTNKEEVLTRRGNFVWVKGENSIALKHNETTVW